jgi:predicted amidophosphoribosyltransferase
VVRETFTTVFRPLVGAVFPMACPGCGRSADPVCSACAALVGPAPSAPPPRGVDAWCAAFAYEGVAREIVARVKYRGAHAAVEWLAREMVATGRGWPALDGVDVVTWAPTTVARRRGRGFDHAELLARQVARRLGLPVRSLLRRDPGPPQTGLAAADRRRGPGFTSRRRAPARVLLVDDVATTGATLAAAAGILRRAGAVSVIALTAARTPAPGTRTARVARVAGSHATACSRRGAVDTGEHQP